MAGRSTKHDYRVMSSLKCKVCKKPIKLNVAERKQSKDLLCYDHFRDIGKGTTRTARECRRMRIRKCDRIV